MQCRLLDRLGDQWTLPELFVAPAVLARFWTCFPDVWWKHGVLLLKCAHFTWRRELVAGSLSNHVWRVGNDKTKTDAGHKETTTVK
jgi:hypothetical protein